MHWVFVWIWNWWMLCKYTISEGSVILISLSKLTYHNSCVLTNLLLNLLAVWNYRGSLWLPCNSNLLSSIGHVLLFQFKLWPYGLGERMLKNIRSPTIEKLTYLRIIVQYNLTFFKIILLLIFSLFTFQLLLSKLITFKFILIFSN